MCPDFAVAGALRNLPYSKSRFKGCSAKDFFPFREVPFLMCTHRRFPTQAKIKYFSMFTALELMSILFFLNSFTFYLYLYFLALFFILLF